MQQRVTYIFNIKDQNYLLAWGLFNDIDNKYFPNVHFMLDKNDKDYVVGFSTNERTYKYLEYKKWCKIVDDIKEVVRKYNIESGKNPMNYIQMKCMVKKM